MAPVDIFDDRSLDVIRSDLFVDDVRGSLRKSFKRSDTAIRMATDEQLQKRARRFCRQHLDKYFPDIHTAGVPDAQAIQAEVLWICRNLRTELLNKSRSKSPLAKFCISKSPPSAQSSQPAQDQQSATNVPSVTDSSPTPEMQPADAYLPTPDQYPAVQSDSETRAPQRSRKRSRKQDKKRSKKRKCRMQQTESTSTESGSPRTCSEIAESTDCVEVEPQLTLPDVNDTNQPIDIESDRSSEIVDQLRADQLSETTSIFMKQAFVRFAEQLEEANEENKRLQMEHDRLLGENKMMADHHKFVENTLRLCQDTYLMEEHSARAIGVFTKANQCNAVVNALRDIRSDVDYEYFEEYFELHGHAPPSRYWLDGSSSLRLKYL